MNDYTVRRFTDNDASEVSELITTTLRTTNIKDYSEEYIEADVAQFTPENVIQRAGWTHFYVVCEGERIVGCGAIGPYWGKTDESSLFNIFVLPEYQGKGIGKLIINKLEKDEYFFRAKRIEIPASITACEFYKKMGYTYKNGIDVVDDEQLYRLEKYRIVDYYRNLISEADGTDAWNLFGKELQTALCDNDYSKMKNVFYHQTKLKVLALSSSGCDHSGNLWWLLDLLACDDFNSIYRAFPEDLPLSSNGYPMDIHATNLLLCIMYNSDNKKVHDEGKVIEKAEKFTASKKPVWDRAVVACLLAIMSNDVTEFSANLQKVCEGYNKIDISKLLKIQCQCAYGLVVLAKRFWTEEKFAQIEYPDYKNFNREYIEWFLSQQKLSDELCFAYTDYLEELNDILKKPIAITRIHQPYLNSDNIYLSSRAKKEWYLDKLRMWEEFTEVSL